MIDFLTLFAVRFPDNVKAFLEIFNIANPLKIIPNPFKNLKLYDDNCESENLEDTESGSLEDPDCQILRTSGGYVALFIVIQVLLFLMRILTCRMKPENPLRKLTLKMSHPNLRFMAFSAVQLDAFLSTFTNIKRFRSGTVVADLNLLVSILAAVLLISALVYFTIMTASYFSTKITS